MGTTGASMVLIHPLLRANAHRRRKVHLVVFVIVLVANASGHHAARQPAALSRSAARRAVLLAGPQLFGPLLVITLLLLAAFYLIDRRLASTRAGPPERQRFRFRGWWNIGLILAAILRSCWRACVPAGELVLLGTAGRHAELAADAILLAVPLVSDAHHAAGDPPGQRLHLASDRGGGDAVRCHLRHHRPGGRDAAGRAASGPLAPLLRLTADGCRQADSRSPISG